MMDGSTGITSASNNHRSQRRATVHKVARRCLRGEGIRSRVGCCFYCDASMVMTSDGQTFQKNFWMEVSEDLLGDTERIILDELVSARLRYTTQLHLIVSRTELFSSDREWNYVLLTLGYDW